ncbi:MAG: glycosyltransferase family 9 protein [Planctomycetota bacterium]
MPRELQPQRILIVRLSAMGDVIHGIPVACALRDAFPEAEIGWVVEGRNGDLLEGHPAIDHLIRVRRRWLKSRREVMRAARELRALRFDTTVDLQCLSKSAIAARLSGAPRRIGYAGPLGREVSKLLNNERIAVSADHVIDRYLALAHYLGAGHEPAAFRMPENPADQEFAKASLAELGLAEEPFAIVNPGAGWASKRWPPERYGGLAARLQKEHGIRSLAVWGGAQEEPLAEQIVAASEGAAILAPATTMTQLASLSRHARLFVGSDTGPLHLAVAVGTPSISLHGTSLAAETGAYGPAHRTVQAAYDDKPGRRRHNDDSAMRAITTEMVGEACGELLGTQPGLQTA